MSDGHFELRSISTTTIYALFHPVMNIIPEVKNGDQNFQIKRCHHSPSFFSGIKVVIDLEEAVFVVRASM